MANGPRIDTFGSILWAVAGTLGSIAALVIAIPHVPEVWDLFVAHTAIGFAMGWACFGMSALPPLGGAAFCAGLLEVVALVVRPDYRSAPIAWAVIAVFAITAIVSFKSRMRTESAKEE
jgi:hypothetical protein